MGVFEVLPCAVDAECLNSIKLAGMMRSSCGLCRLSVNGFSGQTIYWKPVDGHSQHPAVVAAKLARKQAFLKEKKAKRLLVNKDKKLLQVRAEKAERQTETNFIKATKNSGRTHKDGDQVAYSQVTIDTKLQSKCIHPVVRLDELAKVREDAQRGGNSLGVLMLRNRHGIGVIAIAESDFARLLARLG